MSAMSGKRKLYYFRRVVIAMFSLAVCCAYMKWIIKKNSRLLRGQERNIVTIDVLLTCSLQYT